MGVRRKMKSREEIRFLTLLSKAQEKAANLKNGNHKTDVNHKTSTASASSHESGDSGDEWRLPKFVQTLDEWLQALERHPQGPAKDVLVEYKARVDFLKKVLDSRNP